MGNYKYRRLLGLSQTEGQDTGDPDNGGLMSLRPLVCPEVPGRYWDSGGHTYGMNTTFARSRTDASTDDRPVVIRRTAVKHPSEKLQMVDAVDWHVLQFAASIVNWDSLGEDAFTIGARGTVAYRHSRAVNVLYFDGHGGMEGPEPDLVVRHDLWRIME